MRATRHNKINQQQQQQKEGRSSKATTGGGSGHRHRHRRSTGSTCSSIRNICFDYGFVAAIIFSIGHFTFCLLADNNNNNNNHFSSSPRGGGGGIPTKDLWIINNNNATITTTTATTRMMRDYLPAAAATTTTATATLNHPNPKRRRRSFSGHNNNNNNNTVSSKNNNIHNIINYDDDNLISFVNTYNNNKNFINNNNNNNINNINRTNSGRIVVSSARRGGEGEDNNNIINNNMTIIIAAAISFIDDVQKCRTSTTSRGANHHHHPTTTGTGTSSSNSNSNINSRQQNESLPGYCLNLALPQPHVVAIRGERHSGTNLIQSLILDNTQLNKQQNQQDPYGWKHGLLRQEDKFDTCTDVLLVIARDAFSWILKMFNEPYNMIFEDGMHEFGPFLKGKYQSQKWEFYDYYNKKRGINCSFPMEKAINIVQLRSVKYKNWLSENPSYINIHSSSSSSSDKVDTTTTTNKNKNKNAVAKQHPDFFRSYIRYESLIELGQQVIMEDFFDMHCIPHRIPLKEVNDYKGFHYDDWKMKKQRHEEFKKEITDLKTNNNDDDDVLSMYTIDELRFVLDNLDLDFERRKLNYNYEYVEDHIRRRQSNETWYKGPPKLSDERQNRRKDLAKQFQSGTLDISPAPNRGRIPVPAARTRLHPSFVKAKEEQKRALAKQQQFQALPGGRSRY